ncbi:dermonecrotic toxin domain-containing protein [Pseudomonas sp. DWP3-1-2]|uniref:dermonecrotic toxin domain-containing protein n=1 Tax=Pseudomonas sp. DWP3-1-2 TaxID=2804645 RepID=UPI003CE9C8D1
MPLIGTPAPPAPAEKSTLGDELRLKKIARRYIEDYPDVHGTAYAVALQILKKHTTRRLDPNTVHWHRFSDAVSSSRTFTGWEHSGTPTESMTLVELVMHRFSAVDQEASDELQVYGGFYTDGPQHGIYDERNEVAMLPQVVLQDFWAVDFGAAYQRRVDRFWATHGEHCRTLTKAYFLAAAGQAQRAGTLLDADYQSVIHAVAVSLPSVMTLSLLQARDASQPGISLRSFDIGEYVAHDIVRIVDGSGAQILYVPGTAPAFLRFSSDGQLRAWVLERCATEVSRTAFTLHFFPSQAAKDQEGGAFDRWIGQLQRNEWSDQKVLNRLDRAIKGDVFEHLRDLARQNMHAQARLLTSNASLRKQMWIGYLNAFIRVLGASAPLGWPVALTLVGAGLANVGLNIDQAVNGNTPGLRKAGVLGAVFNSVFVAFNLPMLAAADGVVSVEDWVPVADDDASLADLHGNLILEDAAPKTGVGRLRGVVALSNGETWIEIRGLPYRVLFSEELHTWTVVDPLKPFAFQGARPVRLNALDEWELLEPPKLKGGAPMQDAAGPSSAESVPGKPYVTTKSSFWDLYMKFDLAEEERLSVVARERQKACVDETVRECDSDSDTDSDTASNPDEYITTNSEGERVLIDAWGDEHRLFKTGTEYIGGRVADYTQYDEMFNTFLRTGESQSARQLQLIEELAEDIDSIGCNNDVDLYRGGSGHRGTSGVVFRTGKIKPGDILVNTDFTSFSENPYLARVFSSSQAGVQSHLFEGDILAGAQITFDDTSVVFELPKKSYHSATPIAPFSGDWEEAESVFKPGAYFQIYSVEEVVGEHYAFIKVQMKQTHLQMQRAAQSQGRIFDLRTGEPFNREQYAARLGPQGKAVLELFFPQ